jgi:hypothetical protein
VISPKKKDMLRIKLLTSKQESQDFQRITTAINIITKEEVVSAWRVMIPLEDSNKIVKITVKITNNDEISNKPETPRHRLEDGLSGGEEAQKENAVKKVCDRRFVGYMASNELTCEIN